MRKYVILVWLMLPLLAGAYHFGPGQKQLEFDGIGRSLAQADQAVEDQQWAVAVKLYEEALSNIPAEKIHELRRVRLEKAKAQMEASQLPLANRDLKTLVDEMEADQDANPQLLNDSRQALASSQYYITWLMRLEGVPKERWEPEIESARQTFRLLAEDAKEKNQVALVKQRKEDLESSILLARLDLKDLQGLPLPSQ